MAKIKYKSGQLYKHKKHDFIIKLLERHKFGKVIFEVVFGKIPDNLRPDTIHDTNLDSYLVYSSDTLRNSFELVSGIGAEVLYGVKDGD